jgi:HAD superfamily hydrolase (TIGR01490 family)
MTSVAVFDLDNTLIRGSSLFHFGWLLVRRRLISPIEVIRYAATEFTYVRRTSEREGLPSQLAEKILGLVKGASQDELMRLSRDFASTTMRSHLVGDVLKEVRNFQKLGVPCYLATASPQELAQAIADELGMQGALGTQSQVYQGHYTGHLASPICHGAEKAWRVQNLMDREGYEKTTAWAFSDSINDLPLLALVGHPVVVNADKALRQIAQLNSWPVLDSKRTFQGVVLDGEVLPGI